MSPGTADLLDADPTGLCSCELQLRQYGGRPMFDGYITTVRSYDDTVLIKQVLAERNGGGVLVIDGAASHQSALMGDKTAAMAAENGWVGIVINGLVRDVDALSRLPIGIKALGSNPRKPRQDGQGIVNIPVSFGAVTFVPGTHLWSDADGVIVELPRRVNRRDLDLRAKLGRR